MDPAGGGEHGAVEIILHPAAGISRQFAFLAFFHELGPVGISLADQVRVSVFLCDLLMTDRQIGGDDLLHFFLEGYDVILGKVLSPDADENAVSDGMLYPRASTGKQFLGSHQKNKAQRPFVNAAPFFVGVSDRDKGCVRGERVAQFQQPAAVEAGIDGPVFLREKLLQCG